MDPIERIGNVVVATDFTARAHDAALRAVTLPLSRGSSITLVHCLARSANKRRSGLMRAAADVLMRGERVAAEAQARQLELSDIELFDSIQTGRPDQILGSLARDVRAELMVIGRGEPRGLGEHVLGSTAERLVRTVDTAVLVVAGAPAGPYRRPLIAVDLSPVSARARQWALRVSQPNGPIPLVHAHDAPYLSMLRRGGLLEADIQQDIDEEAEAAAERFGHWRASLGGADPATEPVLIRGQPRQVVLAEAKRRKADLIVVGSKAHGRVTELLVGSVAEALVREATCDVLVVR